MNMPRHLALTPRVKGKAMATTSITEERWADGT